MEKHIDSPQQGNSGIESARPSPGPTPILRLVFLLVLATAAFTLFSLGLGDLRRKDVAISQARRYAEQLQATVDEATVLPLNLRIEVLPGMKTRMFAVESLSPQHARLLRGSDQPVIAAWTVPISRRLASDGRAVVFFEAGRFNSRWLTLSQYDELAAAQDSEIRRRAASP